MPFGVKHYKTGWYVIKTVKEPNEKQFKRFSKVGHKTKEDAERQLRAICTNYYGKGIEP